MPSIVVWIVLRLMKVYGFSCGNNSINTDVPLSVFLSVILSFLLFFKKCQRNPTEARADASCTFGNMLYGSCYNWWYSCSYWWGSLFLCVHSSSKWASCIEGGVYKGEIYMFQGHLVMQWGSLLLTANIHIICDSLLERTQTNWLKINKIWNLLECGMHKQKKRQQTGKRKLMMMVWYRDTKSLHVKADKGLRSSHL